MKYDFHDIEKRWQAYWERENTFATPNPGDADFDPDKPKFYALAMFPYPSGAGLHMGHALNYTAPDIVARYKLMRGCNVLHPMGYDAFGLPAEQYAIEHGVHPRVVTEQNIVNMTRQFKRLGLYIDWSRCFSTTDTDYYRWTQWIFLQLYNSYVDPVTGMAEPISELVRKLAGEDYYLGLDGELIPSGAAEDMEALAGLPVGVRKWRELDDDQRDALLAEYRLAYLAQVPVNWCPGLGTVLANEEVTNDGRSERGNYPVHKRPLRQWMLRITAYADRLEKDLALVDWPEPIKLMQRNWIGRSEGARVDFPLADESGQWITVFTTRPDTLFGATYMVLAPEHPLVEDITTDEHRAAVAAYRKQAEAKTDIDRQADTKEKTGVFTGAYAINPVNDEKVPIWIADYVMMGYGTGAIMAVPAHDDRDFQFAHQHHLPIRDVVYSPLLSAILAFCQRYDPDQFDEPRGKEMFADFVGLCMNQNRHDYDEVWKTIQTRRAAQSTGEMADFNLSARGSISNIWKDTVDGLVKNGFGPLLQAARESRLVEMLGNAYVDDGSNVHSGNDEISLDGLDTAEAKRRITQWLEKKGIGTGTVQYKLRDWLFSRQRYWGEPFPILHEADGGIIALDESELPVELPPMEDFTPRASDSPDAPPRPPLGRAPQSWRIVERDGVRCERELNTMPQWAGSCWYYLRFCDPRNDKAFVDPELAKYWMKPSASKSPNPEPRTPNPISGGGGVDLYIGGVEHAVLHLLYARFWHKVLYDLGHVSTPEPFARLVNQGYILEDAFRDERGIVVDAFGVVDANGKSAFDLDRRQREQGEFTFDGKPVTREFGKMGKSLKNSISPDEIMEEYGADTLRLYLMYLGPLDQAKPWSKRDITGVHRFLQRLWRNLVSESGDSLVSEQPPPDALDRLLHKTIARVTEDMDRLAFNTAIAALIELNNELVSLETVPRAVAEAMARMLAPLAPHIAEELWWRLGHGESIARAAWPEHDPAMLVEDEIELPVQVNGKVRGRITVPADADDAMIQAAAQSDPKVAEAIDGKTVRKVIVVKGRLVNLVVG